MAQRERQRVIALQGGRWTQIPDSETQAVFLFLRHKDVEPKRESPWGTASSTPLLEGANDLGSWQLSIALYGSHICSHGTRKGVIGSKVAAFLHLFPRFSV
ncbi:hypothetical protein PspLS_03426 [Pyricularia sp. CBS 133598]|nr:hypothetical protein PspLS_03426 [Pyricularia sp. CBS 133598]